MRNDVMKVTKESKDLDKVEEENLEELMVITLLFMKRKVKIHKSLEI